MFCFVFILFRRLANPCHCLLAVSSQLCPVHEEFSGLIFNFLKYIVFTNDFFFKVRIDGFMLQTDIFYLFRQMYALFFRIANHQYIITLELFIYKNVKKCKMEFSENYLHSQNAFFFGENFKLN